MFEQDELLSRVIRHVRRTPSLDPAFDQRVMAAITALPKVRRRRRWPWRLGGAGLALAATLAALIVRPWSGNGSDGGRLEFVLIDPGATTVALVGDFNDWDPARTPMRPERGPGVWAAAVVLAPGRYRYAFLVNGAEWRADPGAPRALDDEFGAPSSVVTVAPEGGI